jgi:predicted double-glycine peptidase
MAKFRLLTQTRQITEYSCGASALQAVLRYWGKNVDEDALMKLMGTNDEVGTYPADMVRGAQTLGFAAEFKENATLEDLEQFTGEGHPVIALGQVWRSQKDTPVSASDEWDCGHYIVVLAVDKDYVYFQDPYIRMGKGFVPRSTFQEHWHQIMGGRKAAAKSPVLMQPAIFVRGGQPAHSSRADMSDAEINIGEMGSVTVIGLHFSTYLMPFDFLSELKTAFEEQMVRPDAFVLLQKDRQGRIAAMQGGNLEEEADIMEVNALVSAIATEGSPDLEKIKANVNGAIQAAAEGDFGLSAAQLRRRAERLAPETSEVIILFENLWERRLKEVAQNYMGMVAEQRHISAATLGRLGRHLSEIKVRPKPWNSRESSKGRREES